MYVFNLSHANSKLHEDNALDSPSRKGRNALTGTIWHTYINTTCTYHLQFLDKFPHTYTSNPWNLSKYRYRRVISDTKCQISCFFSANIGIHHWEWNHLVSSLYQPIQKNTLFTARMNTEIPLFTGVIWVVFRVLILGIQQLLHKQKQELSAINVYFDVLRRLLWWQMVSDVCSNLGLYSYVFIDQSMQVMWQETIIISICQATCVVTYSLQESGACAYTDSRLKQEKNCNLLLYTEGSTVFRSPTGPGL